MSKCDVIQIKPEVNIVPLRRQSRTESPPCVTGTKNLVKIGGVVPKTCSRTDKHTDRQTDTLITILRFPIGGGVIATPPFRSRLYSFIQGFVQEGGMVRKLCISACNVILQL